MSQLTPEEVASIIETRSLLRAAVERADHMGRLAETLTQAETALFRVLNIANAYYGEDLTYEQLHGRPESATRVDEVLRRLES